MGLLQFSVLALGLILLLLCSIILLYFSSLTDKIANFLGHKGSLSDKAAIFLGYKGSLTDKELYIYSFTLLIYIVLLIFILVLGYVLTKMGLGYL